MPGRIEFEVGFTRPDAQPAARRPRGEMLRILVLGDFTGRANRGLLGGLEGRPAVAVDIDNLDSVQERFAPELLLPLAVGGPEERLVFRSLDDFHPEALYRSLPSLRALGELRGRLQDPARFEEAAAEFRAQRAAPAAPTAPVAEVAETTEGDGDTLARLLGKAPTAPAPKAPAGQVDISAFIRSLVAPHVTQAPDPGQPLYVQAVDETIGAGLAALLHHPDFQALEAAWRGLWQLITGLESEGTVQVAVMDASRDEVAAALAGGDPAASALYRPLAEPEGGAPWSLLVGLYTFGPEELGLLGQLGALAERVGAPFLATAGDGLLGAASAAAVAAEGPQEAVAAWQALRTSAAAPWVGLAWPRLLQRLPYGARTDPVDGFAFEEQGAEPDPATLLWGSPALACALLIGRAFEARGWQMEPGDVVQLDELPAYTYELDGLPRLYPCAEAYFSERVMGAVLGCGVMPFVSFRDRNAVRLARFQSIAEPLRALAGPWN